MENTVYIDVVFAVNIVMDAVVLAILDRILSYGATKRRIWAGAAVGSLWACLVTLCPDMPAIIQGLGTYVAAGSLMSVTAFRLKGIREIARSVAGIYLVSVVLGGMLLMLYEHTRAGYYARLAGPFLFWVCAAGTAAAVCWGLSGHIKGMLEGLAGRRDLCRAILWSGDRRVEALGLIDTGNRLREPVSGHLVHVAEKGPMLSLTPSVKGVVYVPYQSVGGTGLLPAVYIDRMEIRQQGKCFVQEKPLIAVATQKLSPSGEYKILIQRTGDTAVKTGKNEEKQESAGGHFHDVKSIRTQSFSA